MRAITRLFSLIALFLCHPLVSFAGDQALCPEKTLDKGSVTGVYTGIIEQEGMPTQIGIKMEGDAEPTHLFADRDTATKIFGDAVGKLVTARYKLEQYWNDAEMWCFRGDVLTGGEIIGNAPASPQKMACPRKVLETRTAAGVYHGLVNNDIDVYSIALGHSGSDDILIQSSQKDVDKWFANAENKNVSVTYQVIQYWDEKEEECLRMDKIMDVKLTAEPAAAVDGLAGAYVLAEKGFSGELTLGAPDSRGMRQILVSTVNEASTKLCGYEGKCKASGKNSFVCSRDGVFAGDHPADPDDSPVRFSLNNGLVEITAQNGDMCGNGASMLGKYKLKNQN